MGSKLRWVGENEFGSLDVVLVTIGLRQLREVGTVLAAAFMLTSCTADRAPTELDIYVLGTVCRANDCMTFSVLDAKVTVAPGVANARKSSRMTGEDGIAHFEGELPAEAEVLVRVPGMPLVKPIRITARVKPNQYNLQEVTLPPLATSGVVS